MFFSRQIGARQNIISILPFPLQCKEMNFPLVQRQTASTLIIWILLGNLLSLSYMISYAHIRGVSTFANWLPTILSTLSSVAILSTLKIAQCQQVWQKWIFQLSLALQLTSTIVLSVINHRATSLTDETTALHELTLGTEDDVNAMIQIIAMFSTSYNWLVTSCIFIFTFLTVSFPGGAQNQ